jgi:predicted TIM-barrel fold metal-dependent hydrolase
MIIDAQIHDPHPVAPLDDGVGEEVRLLLATEMAREAMDAVGVDVAMVNTRQEFLDYCVARYPDRFLGCAYIEPRDPELERFVALFRERPGMLALRARCVDWSTRTLHEHLSSGALEPAFALAERHGVPVFCSSMGVAGELAPVAETHPALTLVIDHLGVSSPPPMRLIDPDPWAYLPAVLALARYPNVAVKFSGYTALSREPYPHNDLWPHLTRIVEAFGPERLLWASDYTRLQMGTGINTRGPKEEWGGLYSETISMLRDTTELSASDKELIFGGTFRRLMRWPEKGER